VLYPCSYGAKHEDLECLIGPDGILRPAGSSSFPTCFPTVCPPEQRIRPIIRHW
jgi:hypothetical protein